MNVESIGTYHGTPVVLVQASRVEDVHNDVARDAAMLLWVADVEWTPEAVSNLVTGVLHAEAPGLTVTGPRLEELFYVMFAAVNAMPSEPMTALNVIGGLDVQETVEEFIVAAVPPACAGEERCRAVIVLVGTGAGVEMICEDIVDTIRGMCEQS